MVVPADAQSCVSNGMGTTDCEVPTGNFTYNTAISDTNLVINTTNPNNGTLTLGGTNTQTNTTIDAGQVDVSSAANLGGSGAGLTLTIGGSQSGGGNTFGNVLETTGFTWNGSITTGGTGGDLSVTSGQSGTFAGNINNAAALDVGSNGTGTVTLSGIISGAGTLTLQGGTLALSGTNTYTGATTITAGTLQISADANLGNAAESFTLNGGILEAQATFASARGVTLGGGTIQPDSGDTLTLSGLVSGSGGLKLNGAGTLILSDASNSFTGGITITAGNLSVGANGDLGNGQRRDTERGRARQQCDVHHRAERHGQRRVDQPRRGDGSDGQQRDHRVRRADRERRRPAHAGAEQQLHGRRHGDGRHALDQRG